MLRWRSLTVARKTVPQLDGLTRLYKFPRRQFVDRAHFHSSHLATRIERPTGRRDTVRLSSTLPSEEYSSRNHSGYNVDHSSETIGNFYEDEILKAESLLDYSISKRFSSEVDSTRATVSQEEDPVKGSRYGAMNYPEGELYDRELFERQVADEEEQINIAVERYTEMLDEMLRMGKGTEMKQVHRLLLNWYEPLTKEILKEVTLVLEGVKGFDREIYGPYILALPVEKLAVITLDTTVNQILRLGNAGVPTVQLAMSIADLLEMEVNMTIAQKGKKTMAKWQKDILADPRRSAKNKSAIGKKLRMLAEISEMQARQHKASLENVDDFSEVVGEDDFPDLSHNTTGGNDPLQSRKSGANDGAVLRGASGARRVSMDSSSGSMVVAWSREVKVKLGAALVALLVNTARTETMKEKVFYHDYHYVSTFPARKQGIIKLNPEVFVELSARDYPMSLPRHLPMLVPPKVWNNRQYFGAYFRLKAPLMKANNAQKSAVKQARMDSVLEALNYLGRIPWRINRKMFDVIMFAWERGMEIGEIPPGSDIELPKKEDYFDLHTVVESNSLKSEDAAANSSSNTDDPLNKESDAKKEEKASTETAKERSFNQRKYEEMCRRVRQKNAELHSLRCDMKIKLAVAEKYLDDIMYYPHNLDFRGRAYPVPPNLSHLGSDLCRSLLVFADRKPLGPRGFNWLKIHLANLCGFNKSSFEDRVAWTESHITEVRDSARLPYDGTRWWMSTESPFQALATCIEIDTAMRQIEEGSISSYSDYLCSLPVHQDGSCNGLQHYAGLGRDETGGKAVNLVSSSSEHPHSAMQQTAIDGLAAGGSESRSDVAGAETEGGSVRESVRERDGPQDVYSKVLEIVTNLIEEHARIPADDPIKVNQVKRKYARLVQRAGVDRKVIKQTVMTSVYGVTRTGARQQIQARLEEKMKDKGDLSFAAAAAVTTTASTSSTSLSSSSTSSVSASGIVSAEVGEAGAAGGSSFIVTPEMERELFVAANYLAGLVFESLGNLFSSAQEIMDWLATCASIVASTEQSMAWVTPLGLPVVQPYRLERKYSVQTVLQSIVLAVDDEHLPVSKRKQRSAFPPNFVHSLDSTHMLLTALRMQDEGKVFAAVHDSYWTHACDVDLMNKLLRDCFVELYEFPILEDLLESLQMRYPEMQFPPIPRRGTLDIQQVKHSAYFFH